MKYSLVIFSFLFLIIFTFSSTAQETAKANKGEGVLQFLKRFNRTKSFHFDRFVELNRDKLDKNNGPSNRQVPCAIWEWYLLPLWQLPKRMRQEVRS